MKLLRPVRALKGKLLPLVLSLSLSSWLNTYCQAANHELVPPGIADAPGVWANVWNYPTGDLDAYCQKLRAHGIRNMFIQSTRTNMPAIAHAKELGDLIDACHRHKIRVIAWAYLELTNPIADADKMIAAAKFQSPQGERLDGVAPDLEKNLSLERVESFSKRLREQLGPHYPLIAVVYSPLNHAQEVARIPWATLAKYYDVIAPMCYWNSKYMKLDAYDYTSATVRTVRQLTGRPDLEIHVIGDGMGTSGASVVEFLKACRKSEATSASIYPNQQPTAEQLTSMARYGEFFEPNSRFRLAAYRQMLRSGAIDPNSQIDPAEPLSRADFYSLVSRHLKVPVPPPDASTNVRAPIYPHEAFGLLAHLVDTHQAGHKKRRAVERWFVPPVMAEASQQKGESKQPLNLLDASQMVLQASSSIRPH